MWADYLYLTEARAKEIGFTHSGSLYGVPAWIMDEGDEEELKACPKVPALQLYAIAMDTLFDWLTYFIHEDQVVETPIVMTRPIGAKA